jgi:uncharacterized protein involved in type VI secretion and phage assembly
MYKDDKQSKAGQVSTANANKLVTGIVADNVHPEGDYRVKVKFPTLPGTDTSYWCRIMTFGAGPGGQGMFFLPEVDDEVVVAFMHGDFNQGVILGSVWNGKDKPAFANHKAQSPTGRYSNDGDSFRGTATAKQNDIRSISSRAKHELIFNDNKGKPRVTLQSGQKHRIVFNDDGNQPTRIEIYDGKEENYILIDTKNKKITIESKTGDILIKAKEKVTIEAKEIDMKSQEDTSIDAGKNFSQTAMATSTLNALGDTSITSSATITIKGSKVKIN